MNRDNWVPDVLQQCQDFIAKENEIPERRKKELASVAYFIKEKRNQDGPVKLIVICTHNSRRSHFGQIWLKVAGDYFDVDIETYSGGTEATAFHPNAVAAIERHGFRVSSKGDNNPIYSLSYSSTSEPIRCHSKKFDDTNNPSEGFGAILVCNDAAEACPFVPGAEERFVLPYSDPKEFDGTDIESEKYDERCQQIGIEMFYVLGKL